MGFVLSSTSYYIHKIISASKTTPIFKNKFDIFRWSKQKNVWQQGWNSGGTSKWNFYSQMLVTRDVRYIFILSPECSHFNIYLIWLYCFSCWDLQIWWFLKSWIWLFLQSWGFRNYRFLYILDNNRSKIYFFTDFF